ncbi:MAG: UDP-glucose/iron transport system permease protein [Solirubrobacteraceae bacterium]|jgi:putative ABC transport system permease protein|nr:UDP-glucose/iron transport system permease protein [Solirubrobacteraceae bacterium]
MSGAPTPGYVGVAIAALLIGVCAAVVVRQRLGLGRDVLVASIRVAIQLSVVGVALVAVFRHGGLPGAFAWIVAMVLLAGRTAGHRARGLPGAMRWATVGVGAGAALAIAVIFGARVLEAQPRIVVPIGGMVVSAAMQGATIALARVRDEAQTARAEIEARLALGLPGPVAFAPHARFGMRAALGPAIDQTKVVGLIALPGTMTGLIIAGISPLTAVRYQFVVQCMWLCASSVAALLSARLATRALFDDAHRLRPLVPVRPSRWALRRAA